MITFNRTDNNEYSLEYGLVDVCDVCNKKKPFPAEWITGNNNDISPEFAKYALPLIKACQNMYLKTVYRNICTENKITVNFPRSVSGDF